MGIESIVGSANATVGVHSGNWQENRCLRSAEAGTVSDLTMLTDKELVQLLNDIRQSRRLAILVVLRYRKRRREVRAEIARRVSEETKRGD